MCNISLLLSLLLILAHSEGAAFLSKWLLSPVSRRQNPGSLWQCPSLPPDMTYCSHSSFSPESIQEANVWIALMSSRCHPQAMKFVCTVYNPVCLHSHQVMPILPCREFCNEVHSACVSRMYLFGFKWPQQVDCNRFPSEETSMCVSFKRESVTCTPCVQDPSKENIIKKYCQADAVVKSQISRVTAFGNTSSLLIKLDRVSEQLLPQPLLPSPGSLKPNRLSSPSTGFVDTNDERLMLLGQANRLKTLDKQVIDIMAHEQADQPSTYLSTTPSPKSLVPPTTGTNSTCAVTESLVPERRKRRREEKRLNTGRRRDKRSLITQLSQATEASLDLNMLLECAGCSLQLPTSPMAPNSATRWLIMAKKLERSRLNLTSLSPRMQITSLMTWQKDVAGFRDALRDIRNIPRDILCNPNTKVELNLDSFRRTETTPLSSAPRWNRPGWASPRTQPTPPWNLPGPFEGLFQNDAAAVNRKIIKQRQQMQRQRNKSHQQKHRDSIKVNGKPMDEEVKERRRRRRKAREERLSRMTAQQREAWLARRRTRRAQKRNKKLGQVPQPVASNQTSGQRALSV